MKHLRYFDALARWGHFGRAAEDCGITQPALSVQVRELEALLGTPLVERGARAIRLTGFGEEVAARARDVLSRVNELGDLARVGQGPLSGQLRLGVIPTIAPYLLPRMIGALGRAFPGLELRPRETVTGRLIEDLNGGRLDAAIVALPTSEPGVQEAPLFDEEFVLVRPESEADAPVPGAEDLGQMRLLLLEEGHCFRDQALSFCKLGKPAPRTLMEGSSLATLVQMVGAGIGVTLIPEMAVPVETASARVTTARLRAPRPKRTIGMVWRRSNPLAGHLEQVAEVVRKAGMGGAP